jgi:hypothetical protein
MSVQERDAERLRRRSARVAVTAVAAVVLMFALAAWFLFPFWRAARRGQEPMQTVSCRGSAVVVTYDPAARVTVEVGGDVLGWVDAASGGTDGEGCDEVPRVRNFAQAPLVFRRTGRLTLRCRVPGRFIVQLSPYTEGEGPRPDGSALGIAVGRRHLSIVTAVVKYGWASPGSIYFDRRFCANLSSAIPQQQPTLGRL